MNRLIIILLFIFIVSVIIIINLEKNEVKYVKSTIDNREYLVRDLEDKVQAANTLAKIRENMFGIRSKSIYN